jgi:D-3-phosphoglycerate dehydrogenase
MKVLIATEKPFAAAAAKGIQDILERAGHEVEKLESYTDKADLLHAVNDINALIIRSDKVDAEVMDAAPNLKIVVRAGAGYDNVDLDAATARNIVVMNTPGQNANAVAELVIGMLLYTIRMRFSGKSGTELKGKKLGLLGFGHVAQHVGTLANGFGMEVYAYDAFGRRDNIDAAGLHYIESKEEMFAKCDIISLHIPLKPETRGSINASLFEAMPKNGIVVNTARKEIINEDDLIQVMKQREDIKYITDIQPDKHDEMTSFGDRYLATPKKTGAQTSEANANAGFAAARQIADFFATGNKRFQVNK